MCIKGAENIANFGFGVFLLGTSISGILGLSGALSGVFHGWGHAADISLFITSGGAFCAGAAGMILWFRAAYLCSEDPTVKKTSHVFNQCNL